MPMNLDNLTHDAHDPIYVIFFLRVPGITSVTHSVRGKPAALLAAAN